MAKQILNVRLPEDTLQLLDILVQQGTYKSRSHAIREFSRQYISERGGNYAK